MQTQHTPRNPTDRPRVVIVGAGFGGLNVARKLADTETDVLILDRHNYHGFWPLLYQVATAGLEPESIGYPVRAMFSRHRNVHFQMVEVCGVDFNARRVHTDGADIPYDYLVLAAGSANNYFGNQNLAEHTFGLKDIGEAEELRSHILHAFERAVHEPDAQRRAMLLTFVIVGGGPTGVELAGALSELFRHVLHKDYPELSIHEMRVVLVEGSDDVLPPFASPLRKNARERLEALGVEVWLNRLVTVVEADTITFKDGDTLQAHTVIWAAGVKAADLASTLDVERQRGDRVCVTASLHLPERPAVFVIGDMAYLENFKTGRAYPMLAPVAIQQAQQAAQNILAQVQGQPMGLFQYFEMGNLATIGRRAAIMDAFGLRLTGAVAWLGWLIVHLFWLIGFRNRLIVLMNWAYSYITYDRGVRLIVQRK
ncbi:MAG: NAD(P)/FAD-dependent oxidoreductase [Chloroflexaceae bacterium]|nr:NAD(P)/FAD-dependent oxidoreductase [Chloroflexaceae bacterium]